MKINRIFAFANKVNLAKKSVAKQDLTSFGEKQVQKNDAELISKDSAQALKDKYMSQVSFTGRLRTLEINDTGHEVITNSWDVYNTYGQCVGQNHSYKYVSDTYTAKVAGEGNKEGETSSDLDYAVESAIRNSKNYIDGSRIHNNRSYGLPFSKYNHYADVDVYFTDKNEEVNPREHWRTSYIVYAPGAKSVEPPKPKKSLWDKIFG